MMSEFNRSEYVSQSESLQNYILNVFTHMGVGLALTAATAFTCYLSLIRGGIMYSFVFNGYPATMILMAVVQIGICIFLSVRLTKMNNATAMGLFYVYAVITGITFSTLPLYFGIVTMFQAFVFTALMFGSCVVIGKTTHVDMTRFSGLLLGGLIAIIAATVLQIFIPALRTDSFTLVICFAGIGIFLLLTIFDMQRIKQFYYSTPEGSLLRDNLAVYGAFQLYLDFINIFLKVLRILASRNRK